MRLRELASLLLLSSIEGDEDTEIQGVETDSRKVKQGDLFVCLPGFSVDGHDYAAEAVKRGAVALVVEKDVPVDAVKLFVKDAHYAVSIIAARFYNNPTDELKLIGVTGTNGKTTTTYLLEKILTDYGHKTGVIGTVGMKLRGEFIDVKATTPTTPEVLELQNALRQMRDHGADYAVIEVSSHALDIGRVKGCDFHTAIFTNLTQDHLEYHGTMENYRNAKALLFSRLGNRYHNHPAFNKYAVLNIDDPASDHFRKITAAQVITYGIDRDADIRASQLEITGQGTRFFVQTFHGNAHFHLKLIGKFNVYNVLAAISAALIEGIPLTDIRHSLESMSVVSGRFEAVDEGQDFTVIVDYAHTPDSVENVLKTVREFVKGKLYTVLGCGGDRDRTKRPIMGRIAAEQSDVVVVTSDNPRSEEPQAIVNDVIQGIVDAGYNQDRYVSIVDRAEAIQFAIANAQVGDVVVIAGKGHETYQEVKGQKFDFDDRVEARKAIQRKIAQ
jgi:UDP-N-acetylmuramoyl-L-alanyl-D-glutamate--2,6-diaminopimelate ligase